MESESIKEQEYMFVEWSQSINENTYDLAKINQILKDRFGEKSFKGLDVGGGIGSVAEVICNSFEKAHVDVLDCSSWAKNFFKTTSRKKLIFQNFFEFNSLEKYDFIIFRTVLHHFVGNSERKTLDLQITALKRAHAEFLKDGGLVFVVENFYQPIFGGDITGRLIYELTKLKAPEKLFRKLGANTAGEGVRFRSFESWSDIFVKSGFTIEEDTVSENWDFPMWQRIPFVCKRRFQALVVLRRTQIA